MVTVGDRHVGFAAHLEVNGWPVFSGEWVPWTGFLLREHWHILEALKFDFLKMIKILHLLDMVGWTAPKPRLLVITSRFFFFKIHVLGSGNSNELKNVQFGHY